MTFLASTIVISTYCEGRVDFEVEADSLAEAREIASERVAGTTGAYTLQVESLP